MFEHAHTHEFIVLFYYFNVLNMCCVHVQYKPFIVYILYVHCVRIQDSAIRVQDERLTLTAVPHSINLTLRAYKIKIHYIIYLCEHVTPIWGRHVKKRWAPFGVPVVYLW